MCGDALYVLPSPTVHKQNLIFGRELLSRTELWDRSTFTGLSAIHKLVAPLYYMLLLDTLRKLGQPKWYSPDYWVQMFQV